MDILQWIDAGFRAAAAGFIALIPGTTVWVATLAIYLLIRWIVHSWRHGPLRTEGQSH